jgi:predicted XRE-type DNA-binding protein
VYDELTAEKRRRLRGEGEDGEGYVEAGTAAEQAERAAEQAERQKRDELLRTIYENAEGMTQSELGDAVGLSRSRVADILSEDTK